MKTLIIEINLLYCAIGAAACGLLIVLLFCLFVIARKCRTPKDIRGKVALVKIQNEMILCIEKKVYSFNFR